MSTFTKSELREAYKDVGVGAGQIVYVTGNLGRLGFVVEGGNRFSKSDLLKAHYEVLHELLGPSGTIVFPTHTWGMVSSPESFSLSDTPCDYAFSEYLRTTASSTRQFHPFSSVSAIGHDHKTLIGDQVTYHAYGPNTPWERMVDGGALHVSIGLPANLTISAVHHCEYLAGVPYRYSKTFQKRVLENGTQMDREFSLFVMYRGLDVDRNRNKKIFDLDPIKNAVKRSALGKTGIQSVPLDVFVRTTTAAMQSDPYIWLDSVPRVRPWEK